MAIHNGPALIRLDCARHANPLMAGGTLPAGYDYAAIGTIGYLVPAGTRITWGAGSAVAASVPHQAGVLPDPCPDCGTDRNTLGHEFEGGRLCERCLERHGRRMDLETRAQVFVDSQTRAIIATMGIPPAR